MPSLGAVERAEVFLRVVDLEPGDLPAVVDVEAVVSGPTVSKPDLIFKLAEFLAQVRATTGRDPIIYTGKSFSVRNFDALSSLKRYPLWISHYGAGDQSELLPNWQTWAFWQFADQSRIANAILDSNVFKETFDDLKKFTGIVQPPQ